MRVALLLTGTSTAVVQKELDKRRLSYGFAPVDSAQPRLSLEVDGQDAGELIGVQEILEGLPKIERLLVSERQ